MYKSLMVRELLEARNVSSPIVRELLEARYLFGGNLEELREALGRTLDHRRRLPEGRLECRLAR